MIALLVGGIIVLCVGVGTLIFGIPIKEFSFGNTMIVTGAVVACTGLILIGLYLVGRELQNLVRRLDAGLPVPSLPVQPAADSDLPLPAPAKIQARTIPTQPITAEPRPPERKEETLFARDQPISHDDEFGDLTSHLQRSEPPSPTPPAPSFTAPRHERSARARVAPDATERGRRDILFSSTRRDQADAEVKPAPQDFAGHDEPATPDNSSESASSFDSAWPQQDRPPETSFSRSAPASETSDAAETAEPPRERYQPPRRAEASSVTIVKSGVVDSMAYSLYSDGSIEAQMPEGMVRFASIDELRSHLDQRE